MKLGTNLKHGQEIAENKSHNYILNFNRIMPFEVFSLNIVSFLTFHF